LVEGDECERDDGGIHDPTSKYGTMDVKPMVVKMINLWI